MNYYIAFFAALCVMLPFMGTTSASIVDKFMDANKTCFEENPDMRIDCIIGCVLQKLGFSDADYNPILDKFPSHFQTYLKPCGEEHKSETDKCDKVMKVYQCIGQKALDDVKESVDTCAKDTNTEMDFQTYSEAKYPDVLQNPDQKCFHRCMAIRFESINEDNVLQMSEYVDYFKDFDIDLEKIATDCDNKNTQEDTCDQAAQRLACSIDSIIEEQGKILSVIFPQ